MHPLHLDQGFADATKVLFRATAGGGHAGLAFDAATNFQGLQQRVAQAAHIDRKRHVDRGRGDRLQKIGAAALAGFHHAERLKLPDHFTDRRAPDAERRHQLPFCGQPITCHQGRLLDVGRKRLGHLATAIGGRKGGEGGFHRRHKLV